MNHEPVLCPIDPDLIDRLRAGWTTNKPVTIWLGKDNVLHVEEVIQWEDLSEHIDGTVSG